MLLPSVQLGSDPNCTIFATFAGNMKQIEVVAAIIHDADGRIFATQRGYGDFKDFWEFPGGKMEPGENAEQALKREIWEELETRIVVERLVRTIEWDYPQFHLTMHCFWCRVESGILTLKEHEAARWLSDSQLDSIEWLPADMQLIKYIRMLLK
jgi:8-oxo-dGTP diphosphatase